MKVEFLNNCGVQNLKQQLEEQLVNCKGFSIASAFITSEGIDILQNFLKKNKTKTGSGRLIISLYQSFNSRDTLQSLKHLHTTSKGRLLVHISKNQHFHWKYYGFEKVNSTIAFIGSANFTNSGIEGAGELTTKITLSKRDKVQITHLNAMYDIEFENSISIEKFPLELYKSSSVNLKKVIEKLHPDIINLLNQKTVKTEDTLPKLAVLISGYLTQTTVKLISKTKSHWDRNRWDYFAFQLKREYDRFTAFRHIVVINYYNRRYTFSIHEIKDYTPLKTPDGNYFIAHKPVTKIKRESQNLREQLYQLGINYRARNFFDFKLSTRKAEIIKDIFS